MSKAFTRESDSDDDDAPDPAESSTPLVKNYVTPRGYKMLVDERQNLLRVERPKVVEVVSWAAGNGDRSENGDYIYGKKRLREIDRRVRYLTKRIENAEIVDAAQQKVRNRVFFGATVTYADKTDRENTVTLVGVDEANLEAGLVSWIAPIAKALLKAEIGDTVVLRTPAGPEEIEVIAIRYPGT
jgi:transcription elongation factor GreB